MTIQKPKTDRKKKFYVLLQHFQLIQFNITNSFIHSFICLQKNRYITGNKVGLFNKKKEKQILYKTVSKKPDNLNLIITPFALIFFLFPLSYFDLQFPSFDLYLFDSVFYFFLLLINLVSSDIPAHSLTNHVE